MASAKSTGSQHAYIMLTTRSVLPIFSSLIGVLGAGATLGQDYPNRPLRIVTSEPGGGSDIVARMIADGLAGPLGQPVIVENRAGIIVGEIVSKAAPDGYTLLFAGSSFIIGPLLQKLAYDPVRDFSPVTMTGQAPNILVVHPSLPVTSVAELINTAKARPGQLNYASSGAGSSSHLAGELFKTMAGVNIVRVPYKGASPGLTALVGGETQLMLVSINSAAPHVKANRLRALAVTSMQPSALFPGLPTIAATVPGYEFTGIDIIFAPAKTPTAIVNRLNREIGRWLKTPETKAKFINSGVEAVGSSPEELGHKTKSEIAKWGKIIKSAGDGP